MDRSIRVAVANTPRLLRELLIETMEDQEDMKIVAEIQSESDIARVIEQTVPEFLIMTVEAPGPCPPICVSLLQLHPQLKILALAAEKNMGVLYSASVHINATPLEVSESGLLEALRSKSPGEMGETQ
jgi:DNA-binding NarL/FixJ family response regulator